MASTGNCSAIGTGHPNQVSRVRVAGASKVRAYVRSGMAAVIESPRPDFWAR